MTTVNTGHETGRVLRKALAIDGPALSKMLGANGASKTNFKGLVHVGAKLVGFDLPFAEQPRCTIHPDRAKKGNGLYDDMRRAGILPRPVESCCEADDQRVKVWLHRYSSWHHVADIVLVTCDSDIIAELLWLVELRRERTGVAFRIDVIGTCTLGRNGRCSMGRKILREIKAFPHAHFHEVRNFLPHIAHSRARH